MRLIFIFILSVIPVLAVTAEANSQADQFQRAFMEFLETEVAQDTPGFAITMVIDGETVLTNTYGVSREGSNDRINTDTVFRLASVSKTMASAAVGKLVQEDQLQWDARITDYVQSLRLKSPDYQKRLTIKHVLSQQSGLVPHAYTNYIEDNFNYQRVMQKMHEVPFVCAPGTCYSYQNVIYSVVGEVVQAVANESYDDFVTEKLFRPLNMHTASYGLDKFINNKNHATPHVRYRKNKPWKPVKVKENYYKFSPAAGANASITDMNKWLLAQMGKSESVLNADTLAMMHSKHAKTTRSQSHYHGDDWRNIEGTFYGLGWRVFDYANQEDFVHHGGWVQGMRAEMIFNTQLQSGMVFLTNSETRLAGDVVPMYLQLLSKFILKTDS
jgi:beta-lactamase class C